MNLDEEYSEYRAFINEFASTIDPQDVLPLRISGYQLRDYEIYGEILDWIMTYLGRSCPTALRKYLIQKAIKKTLEKVKESPAECGFDDARNVYQPLKLVREVVAIVNGLIFDLKDNAKLYEVPLPPSPHEITKHSLPPKYSVDAIKNSRRTMEDKHMIIDDFNALFDTKDTEPTSYYGIFDGHSGSDAASYANSHLNYNISVHPKYPSDIEQAMREAFLVTDVSFLKKAKAENLNSGTTALCAIYRRNDKKLYVGWCGDSQALIARVGNVRQIVKKHSPEDESERKRIEKLGGVVLFWGNSYRVNGALAVSRAIGDIMHKPFVSAEPEIECINLDGEEDFIVLGCDGLWDFLTEDDVALTVYKKLQDNPENYRSISTDLCSLAKSQGSRDNISVIVVFLKEPEVIASENWATKIQTSKDIMENLNMFEEANAVSTDPLGNNNMNSFNNPFGDNQLIDTVAIGKATEITDLVTQQHSESDFCNLSGTMTEAMNNINNNQTENVVFESVLKEHVEEQQELPMLEDCFPVSNDRNNNSDDLFGPETNVDMIDEDVMLHEVDSFVAEKESMQIELKEGEQNPMYGAFENEGVCEAATLPSPDLNENNPFGSLETPVQIINTSFLSSDLSFGQNDEMSVDSFGLDQAENLQEQNQAPVADLGFEGIAQQATGESGGEESEDEWNYVKVGEKLANELTAVEEKSETEPDFASIVENQSAIIDNPFEEIGKKVSEVDSEAVDQIDLQLVEGNLKEEGETKPDLTLILDTDEFDEMSQLNPDAKEFVPVSPVRISSTMNAVNPLLQLVGDDSVVSQSPRKGESLGMEDIQVPSEKDFDIEAESRPHETNVFIENGGFLNLKESMQQDDKLENEYKDEAQVFFEEAKNQDAEDYKVLESSFNAYSNGFQSGIEDQMSRSFYEGRDNDEILEPVGRNPDVLNSVQPLPTFDDDQSVSLEVDLEIPQNIQSFAGIMDAPEIVDQVKSEIEDNLQKRDLSFNNIENVLEDISTELHGSSENYLNGNEAEAPKKEEVFNITPELLVIETVDQPKEIENVDQPRVIENVEQKEVIEMVQVVPEEIQAQVLSSVAAAVESAVEIVDENKKPSAPVSRAETKTKAPVSKVQASSAKKTTAASDTKVSAKPAATKPISAPVATKVLAAKKPAPKPAVSSAPAALAARPKVAATSAPPAKTLAKPSASRPIVSNTRSVGSSTTTTTTTITSTLQKKTPTMMAPKPSTRPATTIPARSTTTVKSSLSSSLGAERKPLASTGAMPRNPPKPLSSTLKPKTTSTSTLTSKPATTVRLSTSATAKLALSPTKEAAATKSLVSASKSPRLASTTSATLKTAPSATAKTSPLGVLNKKAPIAIKKPASTGTTQGNPIKKPLAKGAVVKKTAPEQKKTNGEAASEEMSKTNVSDQLLIEEVYKNGLDTKMNGHGNENVINEMGNGEPIQMVLDTAAD